MRILKMAFIAFTVLLVFAGCDKQLADANGISVGILKAALSGDCSPVIINGIFKADSVLTNANYVDVQVNVSVVGSFDVKSDTINGYSFYKTGTVGPGLNTIRLYASGKPVTPGINYFTIKYGTTICGFSITVFSAGTGGALFTLGGSPGNCSINSINGLFRVGQVMTAANKVEMTVNVTAIGSYVIAGTVVNGISFNASGVFINPGVQNVFLTASGTPVAAGTFNYPVTNIATSCNFSITVSAIAPNLDYIPETSYSNWSDKLVGGTATDTSYTQISPNTILLSGNTYKIFEVKNSGIPVDSFFHRKNGGFYYQLFNDDFGIFDTPFNNDGLILDSSLAVNATWTITLGLNYIGGLPVNVKINCLLLSKNTAVIVAGNNYNQVIKVKYSYIVNPGTGDTIYAVEEKWYAKGFGLIYDKINDVPVTTVIETETTRIQIY